MDMQYQITVSFLVYANDSDHAVDQLRALLDGIDGVNDRYQVCSICDEYNRKR